MRFHEINDGIRNSLHEGKKTYKLNLEAIEQRFGEIGLGNGTTLRNQKLIKYLAETRQPCKIYEHILVQKLAKLNQGYLLTENITNKSAISLFDKFNMFSTGNNVAIGDKVAVLELEALQFGPNCNIELSGFIHPKTIVDIIDDYIYVDSGETYPRIKVEQINMWRQDIFFHNRIDAEKCLAYMSLSADNAELSINVQTDTPKKLDEDWKKSLAAAGMAGAMALGAPGTLNKNEPDVPKRVQTVDPAIMQTVTKALQRPYARLLKQHAIKAGIRGPELAQFLAQMAHETQNFTRFKETGGTLDARKYDIRYNPRLAKILGNDKPGDGVRFIGRGGLMHTGKYNYKKLSQALGVDLVNNPELLERPDIASRADIYYWKNRVQPKVDNWENTAQVTKPINSRLDKLDKRNDYFIAVKNLLNPTLMEYNVDNENGLGSVPMNANVNYRGLRVLMRPSTFLKLATPLDKDVSVDYIVKHMENGGALGSPFLIIDIPDGYFEGDFNRYARVIGHEGRNRMKAIQKLEGDDPVEVHIFPQGEIRARHLNKNIVQQLQRGMRNQRGDNVIFGFGTDLLFKPINT